MIDKKNEVVTDDKSLNSITIGLILKAQREHLNLTQKEVADALGLAHYNYISMLERGAKIPLLRIFDIVRIYKLDPMFAIAMIKALRPEDYGIAFEMVEFIHGKTMSEVDAEIQKISDNLISEYNVKIRERKLKDKTYALPSK